jgi:hypothetical protein
MSCFALSKTTCKHLSSAMACYLWGGDGDKRKMHWRKCSEIDQPKYADGMCSILQCLASKVGGLLPTQTLYVLEF